MLANLACSSIRIDAKHQTRPREHRIFALFAWLISHQYSPLRTNQHQPLAASQPNRLFVGFLSWSWRKAKDEKGKWSFVAARPDTSSPRPWTVLRRPRRRLSIHPSCRSTCTITAGGGEVSLPSRSHTGASTHDAADMQSRSLSARLSWVNNHLAL
jgi:hypothetical protein